MSTSTFLIVGVNHGDERNTEALLQHVSPPIACVGHERAADGTFWTWLQWAMRKPLAAIDVLLSRAGNTKPDSECERAARTLAETHGVPFHAIGMEYKERVAATSLRETVFEWAVFGPLVILLPFALSQLWTLAASSLFFLFTVLLARRQAQTEYERREDAMVKNLLDSDIAGESETVVVVVGADHVPGIVSRLRADTHHTDVLWLNRRIENPDW